MHIVYCYVDLRDEIIKYVGITSRKLDLRIQEHKKYDEWVGGTEWKILYFCVRTKSESEAWESHLIAQYETYKWFNKAKKNWGLIQAFKTIHPVWKVYSISDICVDIDYSKYQILDDITDTDLISESNLLLDLDITKEVLLLLVARRVIQPLACTSDKRLLFWKDSIEKGRTFLKQSNV